METGNRFEIQLRLSSFKELGFVSYQKVLAIPSSERITSLIKHKENYLRIAAAISASIKSATNNLNLSSPLSDDQIMEITARVIEESEQDNLSIEDVLLFLGEMLAGKCGKIYGRLDMQSFFELFEVYREERHTIHIGLEYEKHVQYSSMGNTERISDNESREKELRHSALGDYLRTKYSEEGKNTD